MEFLQLRYFCDAAHSENFTVTAKKFGVPPSAVSQSITRLEKELGTSFFTRKANSIKLNAVGREFLLRISSVLVLMDDAVDYVTNNSKKRTLNICIDARRHKMLKIIEKFKKNHPDTDVNVMHGSVLENNDYDIIIADYDLPLSDYEKRLILSEELAIALHKSNPLFEQKNLTVDMLKNEPFITMNEKRPMHQVVMNVCADFGFTPHITFQSDEPSYVGRLVALNLGVAIVPKAPSAETYSKDVIFVPIKNYTRDIYAYILKSKLVLPYVENFLNLLKEI